VLSRRTLERPTNPSPVFKPGERIDLERQESITKYQQPQKVGSGPEDLDGILHLGDRRSFGIGRPTNFNLHALKTSDRPHPKQALSSA
jgi:hypothetical protein